MSQINNDKTSKVYSALGHPIRKKIVEILGEKQHVGFKDLKDAVNVSVGTLYFHLEALDDLIAQDENRKYVLTDKGKLALKLLGSVDEQLEVSEGTIKKEKSSTASSLVKSIIFGRPLLERAISNPKRFIPEVAIILGFGAWLFAETKIEPVMMFYNNQPTWSSSLAVSIEFVAGWLIIFGLSEVLSYIFYKRLGAEASLFVGTVFSLVPLLIPLLVLEISNLLNLNLRINWLWVNVILLVFQAWVLCLLSASLSLAKGLRIERAALISLIVMYLNIGFLVIFFIL